jgi:hypothetical protein
MIDAVGCVVSDELLLTTEPTANFIVSQLWGLTD